MSSYTAATVEDAANNLLEELKTQADGGAACVRACLEHDASDDVAPALLACAHGIAAAGSPVRIVCADGVAAERYRALVADDPLLNAADVVSMRELGLAVMGDARVQDAVGRGARVLDDNELAVLMEDVKVSGLKPGRLREMLKFFYKSMSECADEDERWLITAEEQTVHAILTENLEVRRALLPCEVSSLAYRGLVAAGVESEPLALVVDDYASLSKASQRLVRHLAANGLVAAGRTLAASSAEEPYPCFDGFRALADEADCLVTLATERPEAARESRALDDPEAECAFVAASVEECLADGMAPRDVLVAVPNAAWGARMAAALEARGIAVERGFGSGKIKGDPRTEGRFADLKLATFLRLHLDPHDFTSLRSWLGFGDWLLCSDAFLELMAYARERDIAASEAVAQLRTQRDADRASTIFGKFDGPLDELDELQRACADGLTREAAVELFEAHGMPLSPRLVELLGDDAAHADIERLAREAFRAPVEDVARDAVHVVAYARCHGRHVRTAFVTGLVNGFLPANDAVDDKFTIDHRRVALERERALFLNVLAAADERTVCTRFTRDRLENTAFTKVQTTRVFMRDGERLASVAPSEFASLTDEVLALAPDVPRELPTKVLYASTTM